MAADHRRTPAPDYGLDAPGMVHGLAIAGASGSLLGLVGMFAVGTKGPWSVVLAVVEWLLPAGGLFSIFEAGYMVWSSRVGKLAERERILDLLGMQGHESLLDVGCGRGLLLCAGARRLETGSATGVDVWSTRDQSGNSLETTRENARREGVAGRVSVVTGDARSLPFDAGTFDAVVSNIALHNNPNRAAGRRSWKSRACSSPALAARSRTSGMLQSTQRCCDVQGSSACG